MHESAALTYPVLATTLIVAALFACALVLPTRFIPRRTLVAAALLMGAGIAAAAGTSSWLGHGTVTRTDVLTHTSLASILLVLFATTPPLGRRFCGSSAGVVLGAAIMAMAMIASEAI
jgi:hypothetical protein